MMHILKIPLATQWRSAALDVLQMEYFTNAGSANTIYFNLYCHAINTLWDNENCLVQENAIKQSIFVTQFAQSKQGDDQLSLMLHKSLC